MSPRTSRGPGTAVLQSGLTTCYQIKSHFKASPVLRQCWRKRHAVFISRALLCAYASPASQGLLIIILILNPRIYRKRARHSSATFLTLASEALAFAVPTHPAAPRAVASALK